MIVGVSCIGSSGYQYPSSYSSPLSDRLVVTSFLHVVSCTGTDIITTASCTTGGAAPILASNPMMISNRNKPLSRSAPIIVHQTVAD